MSVTIEEFKKWLDKFPTETIVEVAFQQEPTGCESYGNITFKSPKLKSNNSEDGEGWGFIDFRNNEYVKKDSPNYGKCFLLLGET